MLNLFAQVSSFECEFIDQELDRFVNFFVKKCKIRWEGEVWDKVKEYLEGIKLFFFL